MDVKIANGIDCFEEIRTSHLFFVDKTSFIKEWWERKDRVTLITRPRRFGKTLNMSMLECFFSQQYAGRGDLFEGLSVWEEEEYRQLQGTYPVINLSFADLKATSFEEVRFSICQLLTDVYSEYDDFFKEADL
ncbi:MAG: AAA family ATPase, partial [Lachnospiraceae bacterium]|nr:AAA family ATPase [Lachnospiraceae bacterium]